MFNFSLCLLQIRTMKSKIKRRCTSGYRNSSPKSLKKFIQPVFTKRDWDSLGVDEASRQRLEDIGISLMNDGIIDNNSKMINPKQGNKVLFTGPDGEDKILAVGLLAKTYNLQVYRIKLSRVVSKYIGETEKNIAKIFDKAESKNWILFFDEADALFGKRTGAQDSHDKYANQEVSYLLQRIESYEGLIIVHLNDSEHTFGDSKFKHFNTVIHFKKPG